MLGTQMEMEMGKRYMQTHMFHYSLSHVRHMTSPFTVRRVISEEAVLQRVFVTHVALSTEVVVIASGTLPSHPVQWRRLAAITGHRLVNDTWKMSEYGIGAANHVRRGFHDTNNQQQRQIHLFVRCQTLEGRTSRRNRICS